MSSGGNGVGGGVMVVQTVDSLPKQFVNAMRTLFDIMDDKRTGMVELRDIEHRWRDDGTKGLPKGVIESLQKVTPPNGKLSFERFCAGLKICLLRNQVLDTNATGAAVAVGDGGGVLPANHLNLHHHSHHHQLHRLQQKVPASGVAAGSGGMMMSSRPPSAPLLDMDDGGGAMMMPPPVPMAPAPAVAAWNPMQPAGAVGMRSGAAPAMSQQQRTLSMPQLLATGAATVHKQQHNSDTEAPATKSAHQQPTLPIQAGVLYGPPKPPRTAAGLVAHHHERNNNNPLDRAEIRTALQNWQLSLLMMNGNEEKTRSRSQGRSSGDGKPAVATTASAAGSTANTGSVTTTTTTTTSTNINGDLQQLAISTAAVGTAGMYQKKSNVRRREPRRHTLQNGIDYNMLKRMKQIEQEKDILMQGLQAVERTRDWYLKQVAAVQDKIRCLGRMGSHMEQWTEAQQERLELQRARVLEVNRHLATLTDSWERGGLPLHINLAVQHHHHHNNNNVNPHSRDSTTSRLKQQNHLLTEEVSKKSERITMLEREKASLIRELLQTRTTTTRNGQEEAVF